MALAAPPATGAENPFTAPAVLRRLMSAFPDDCSVARRDGGSAEAGS